MRSSAAIVRSSGVILSISLFIVLFRLAHVSQSKDFSGQGWVELEGSVVAIFVGG